jgi:hypothetical protein
MDMRRRSRKRKSKAANPPKIASNAEKPASPSGISSEPEQLASSPDIASEAESFASSPNIVSEAEAPVGPPVALAGADRRIHPRYEFVAAVEVRVAESDARIETRVRDLSQQGCYVDTNNPLPLGTVTDVRITKSAQLFEAGARVVYSRNLSCRLHADDAPRSRLMHNKRNLSKPKEPLQLQPRVSSRMRQR